ncbi:hypothetical protein ACU8IW_002874 [Listeria innocua]|uniref:hypothetical protein n=1 Tax=Listeria TaxID=1637 RepID=UPI000737B10E|nr:MULTISPECIES: hypothetical protein [Listeria]EAC5777283.1 hypothetical protein [Listeria monocytogenes]EAD0677631.1 hypothetical protein [Listeria monocytogenes]EAD7195945.1 hypothetical protein [Listeria monocytogenes]EAE2133765.1 hypothetical protein [Listeria monocytogenes]EAE2151975.1 hypothetical protein [Listeria monocytogenes]
MNGKKFYYTITAKDVFLLIKGRYWINLVSKGIFTILIVLIFFRHLSVSKFLFVVLIIFILSSIFYLFNWMLPFINRMKLQRYKKFESKYEVLLEDGYIHITPLNSATKQILNLSSNRPLKSGKSPIFVLFDRSEIGLIKNGSLPIKKLVYDENDNLFDIHEYAIKVKKKENNN